MFDVPLHVIDDQQIQQAVVIHIQPNRAHGPERSVFRIGLIETGLGRHVRECAISVVVIERVLIDAGDKDVFVSIVVIVGHRDAHIIAAAREACLFGHIREVPMAVVFKKTIEIFRRGLTERFNVRPVGEEDVQLAVVVVVKDGYASCHGFGCMALGRLTTVEFEINGLVNEPDGTGRGGIIGNGLSRWCLRRRIRGSGVLGARNHRQQKHGYRELPVSHGLKRHAVKV